jgi:hypothetical protein
MCRDTMCLIVVSCSAEHYATLPARACTDLNVDVGFGAERSCLPTQTHCSNFVGEMKSMFTPNLSITMRPPSGPKDCGHQDHAQPRSSAQWTASHPERPQHPHSFADAGHASLAEVSHRRLGEVLARLPPSETSSSEFAPSCCRMFAWARRVQTRSDSLVEPFSSSSPILCFESSTAVSPVLLSEKTRREVAAATLSLLARMQLCLPERLSTTCESLSAWPPSLSNATCPPTRRMGTKARGLRGQPQVGRTWRMNPRVPSRYWPVLCTYPFFYVWVPQAHRARVRLRGRPLPPRLRHGLGLTELNALLSASP